MSVWELLAWVLLVRVALDIVGVLLSAFHVALMGRRE